MVIAGFTPLVPSMPFEPSINTVFSEEALRPPGGF